MNILFSSFLLLSNISNFNINYACVDQNIDATFSNYNNALEYKIPKGFDKYNQLLRKLHES